MIYLTVWQVDAALDETNQKTVGAVIAKIFQVSNLYQINWSNLNQIKLNLIKSNQI